MPAAKPTQEIVDPLDYYAKVPSSNAGELEHAQAQLADLNALTFSETSRTPYGGDESRSQGKFPTGPKS